MIVLFSIISTLVAVFAAYKYGENKKEDSLYREISEIDMRNAEMLASQYPEILTPYLKEAKSQNRNLTELEYKMFNYYKARNWMAKGAR